MLIFGFGMDELVRWWSTVIRDGETRMAAPYERIADDLRRRIQSGELLPGERLAAQRELARRHRVGLAAVRQALGVLVAEGLVGQRHGGDAFVRRPRRRITRDNERYQWEKDRVQLSEPERARTGVSERDTGLATDELAFSAGYSTVSADRDLALAFGVPVGTRVLRRTYATRSREEDAPLGLIRSYLVHDMVAGNPALLDQGREPWPGGTQSQLQTVGIEVDRIVDTITVRPPTAEEAEALDVATGVSVIALHKRVIDTSDRVVEVADVVLSADRTELVYTTPLARWPV